MSAVLGEGKAVDLLVIYIFTMICDDELWPWTWHKSADKCGGKELPLKDVSAQEGSRDDGWVEVKTCIMCYSLLRSYLHITTICH